MKFIKLEHNKQISEIKREHEINKSNIIEKIEEIEMRISSLPLTVSNSDIQDIKAKLNKQAQIMQDLQSADSLQGTFIRNELESKMRKAAMQYKSAFDQVFYIV